MLYKHLPSIYPLYLSIYASTMDPMGTETHFYVYSEGLGIPFFHLFVSITYRGSAGGSAYAFLTPAPRELSPAAPGLRGFHEGPGLYTPKS